MDAVSEIIAGRATAQDGLQGMVGASLLAHLAVIALAFFAPLGPSSEEPAVLMTISLGGAVGPDVGGLTQSGARPVQAVSESKKIEPVRAPAAKAPEMIEPKKTAPKKSEAKVTTDPKTPSSRTPTKGEEVRQGSAASAVQAARGQGFGLSSGGGGTGGYLETANFCCPEYIALMLETIRRNWDQNQQASGVAMAKFTIQRDGRITDVLLEKTSGYQTLDYFAVRALQVTRQLQPLPAQFPESNLTVHLTFEYSR